MRRSVVVVKHTHRKEQVESNLYNGIRYVKQNTESNLLSTVQFREPLDKYTGMPQSILVKYIELTPAL